MNYFYELGVGKRQEHVPEYSNTALQRIYEIVEMTTNILLEQTVHTKSKEIPFKSFWATMFASGWMVDNGWKPSANMTELYRVIREIDADLETASKAAQADDKENYKKLNADVNNTDLEELFPDTDYYWKWIPRNQAADYRDKRQADFLDQFSAQVDAKTAPIEKVSNSSVLAYAFEEDEFDYDDE